MHAAINQDPVITPESISDNSGFSVKNTASS